MFTIAPLFKIAPLDGTNICLTEADSVKYLGLLKDKNLTWKPHVVAISTKLARGLGLLQDEKDMLIKKHF